MRRSRSAADENDAVRQQRHAAVAEHVRRDVQPHVVDEALVPRRGVHRRAALEQQRPDLPRGQPLAAPRAKRAVGGDLDLRAARFERRRAALRAAPPRPSSR